MEHSKIRVKVGLHEFEAEGPANIVSEQYESWKALIKEQAILPTLAAAEPPSLAPPLQGYNTSPAGMQGASSGIPLEHLAHLFNLDEKRDIITLRILPPGEDRHREAVLLLLYGFLRLKTVEEVMVTRLKSALESSGSAPSRVDRATIPLLREQLLVKGGSGKGGKYRLTNKGIARAEEMISNLMQQLL